MYPTYRDFEVQFERYQDLLREAERKRIIRAAGLQQSNGNGSLSREVSHWIGAQMVKWGLQLQHRHPTPQPCCNQG